MNITDDYLAELRAALAARAEGVCRLLLPGGKRVAKVWQCGGVDGGPGKSMGVELDGEKIGLWIDRATGESGDLIKLFQLTQGLKFPQAVEQAAEFCRIEKPKESDRKVDPSDFLTFDPAPPPPEHDDRIPEYKAPAPIPTVIDWARCVGEFTPEKAVELCESRGYSVEMAHWLKQNQLIGCYQGRFAFPVHNAHGQVVALHYKGTEGWFYYPKGAATAPLIVGTPAEALHTLAFESQWDAFATLDKLRAYDPDNAGIYAAYITRSATSNTDISKHAIQTLVACPQNDPKEKKGKDGVTRATTNKEGRTPSEEWLHRISTSRNKITQFAVFESPTAYKDANDWIRAEQPDHAEVFKKVIENSRNPILKTAKSAKDLLTKFSKLRESVDGDPNALIGYENRFLSKAGSWIIIGPSGIGKSTLITSLCMHAAAGVNWHGLTFRRPLKTLVVQAENDEGDLAEMLEGASRVVIKEFNLSQKKLAMTNLIFEQVTDKTGEKFTRWLEEIIREGKFDLVTIDPLLSFVGDDISQQKVASQFFRNFLFPVLHRTGAICIIVHHTGKPPKEKVKDADLSYSGLGSSEIVNCPRAVSILTPTEVPDTFLFRNCKRGGRAKMVNQFTGFSSKDIHLKHGTGPEGLQWIQTPYDPPEEDEKPQWKSKGESKKSAKKPEDFMPLISGCSTHNEIYDIIMGAEKMSGYVAKRIIADLLMARLLVKGADHFYRKPEPALFP